jgi:hypothetical protein
MKLKYIIICIFTICCLLPTVCLFSEDDIDDIIDGLDKELKPVPVEERMDPIDALTKVADLMESAEDRISAASNWAPGAVTGADTAPAKTRQQQALDELNKLFDRINKLQSDASSGLKKVIDSAVVLEPKGSSSGKKPKPGSKPKPKPKPQPKDQSDQGPAPRAYDAKGDLPDPYAPRKSDGKKWGNLPPKLRDEIIQSAQEEFLPEYQERLSRYYKILAGQE